MASYSWFKFSEDLLNEKGFTKISESNCSKDSHGGSRAWTLIQILAFSLRSDLVIYSRKNLYKFLGNKKSHVDTVIRMAIDEGIITELEDGSLSTQWLADRGYVGRLGAETREPTRQPTPTPKYKNNKNNDDNRLF